MISSILDPACTNCGDLEVIVGMNPSPQKDAILEILLDLDCKVYPAQSPEDALRKLQFHAFHVAVVEDRYSLDIVRFLATMPMVVRRQIFCVLVGENLETGNMLQSYVLSANLVLNSADTASFANILQGYLLDHNRFYRAFYYAMEAKKKDLAMQ